MRATQRILTSPRFLRRRPAGGTSSLWLGWEGLFSLPLRFAHDSFLSVRPIVILIDGKVTLAPIVRSAIGERALVTGGFTAAEAKRIAKGIVAQ
jgi:hypothetical protein